MRDRTQLYIDGAWVPSTGTGTIEVLNPATEEVVGRVAEGTAEDVDRAVAAARAAFETFSKTSVDERAKYLTMLHEALAARSEEIAALITEDMGAPIRFAQLVQAGLPVTVTASFAQVVSEFDFEETIGNSLVVKEPIGVVGAITPWNYPLHQITNKVVPAIAAGCTVVLKPSEVAPFAAYLLADVMHEIGLPPGVFNLVTGYGPVVGEAIASHPDVDMVSFTGSTAAGKRVTQLAAETVKRVALELGGKSANVVLDDADFSRIGRVAIAQAFQNAGQMCSALTRLVVPRERQAEVVEAVRAAAEAYVPGDPTSPDTKLGPVVSDRQRDRVLGYVRKGVEEGATLVTGSPDPVDGPGYFVRPAVFADVTPEMTIAQEEIFGPVLVVMPYDDEEDALRIANSTPYGLSGGVWSGDPERAKAFARRMRTGQVDVNGGRFNPLAPFGGYKQSGNGRELGRYGLDEFLEVKSIQL